MNRVGVFVDIGDQFFRINKKWSGRKLDYEKYYTKCKDFGEIVRAAAYGTQINKNATKFIAYLHHIGFEPRYKDMEVGQWYSWSFGLCVDIINLVTNGKIDTLILGMSNKECIPLVNSIKEKGVKVIVMSCGIHKELKSAADRWVELSEELLSETVNITN